METSGHQNPTSSSAMNPLYEDPEIKNPYPDLGELEAVNLMMFAYQIASGMVRGQSQQPCNHAILSYYTCNNHCL